MDDLRQMQSTHLETLVDLMKHNNGTFEMLHLIEDCLSILSELNQIEIDSFQDKRNLDLDSLRSVYEDSIDFKRYLKEYISKYNL